MTKNTLAARVSKLIGLLAINFKDNLEKPTSTHEERFYKLSTRDEN